MELKRKVTEAKTEPKKATEEPDEEAWKRDERKQVQSFIIESLGWLIISTAILVYLMHGGLPLWAGLIFCIAPLLLEYTHLQRLWPEFTKRRRAMKKGVEQVATVSEWVYYETKSLMYPDFYIVECIVTTDHYTYTLESERLYYKPVKYIDDNMKVRCLMDETRPRCYYVDFRDILPGYPGGEGRRQYVE